MTVTPKTGEAVESIASQQNVQQPVNTGVQNNKGNNNLPEIELEFSGLPSKGLPYPTGSIIKYSPYKFGEIKKFSQSKLGIKSTFQLIMKGINTTFGNENLTLSDLIFISLLRKISSLGTDAFTANFSCPSCNKRINKVLDYTSIDVSGIKAEGLPLVFRLDSGQEIHMNPITVKGFFDLIDMGVENDDIAAMARQISNMDFKEARNIVSDATGDDIALLQEADSLILHEIKPVDVQCTKCENNFKVSLEGADTLITPFRTDQKSLRSRIQFGIQEHSTANSD